MLRLFWLWLNRRYSVKRQRTYMQYQSAHEAAKARFSVTREGARIWRWEVFWEQGISIGVQRYILARGYAPNEYLAALDAEQAIDDLLETAARRVKRVHNVAA